MQKDHVDIGAAKFPAGRIGAVRRVNQAEVDHLDAGPRELLRHAGDVTFETFLESGELRPVGVESDAEESDFEG